MLNPFTALSAVWGSLYSQLDGWLIPPTREWTHSDPWDVFPDDPEPPTDFRWTPTPEQRAAYARALAEEKARRDAEDADAWIPRQRDRGSPRT